MSVMSELSIDIQELYARGAGVATIAEALQIPVRWVTDALDAAAAVDQQIADNDYIDEFEV